MNRCKQNHITYDYENDDGGILQEDPSDGEALPFAGGEAQPAFTNAGVQTVGEASDPFAQPDLFQDIEQFCFCGVRLDKCKIIPNRCEEKEVRIGYHAQAPAQGDRVIP